MQDDLDENLQSLFQEQSQNLPVEPFLTNMLRLIKIQQSRRVFKRRLTLVLGFCCCALLSRLFIQGSILLSSGLNSLFETTGDFLATPLVMLAAGLCVLSFLVLNRRWIF